LIYIIVIFIFRLSLLCHIKRVFVSRSEMSRNVCKIHAIRARKRGINKRQGYRLVLREKVV